SLGTVFQSFLFPGRAPESMASFTTFLGGATDRAISKLSGDETATLAHTELSKVLAIRGEPAVRQVTRWERAIPQYNIGHGETICSLKALCDGTSGLFLAGNYLSGPSLGACVEQANQVAEEIAKRHSQEK